MAPKGIHSFRSPARGSNHMVVSGHYLATAAGFRVLEQGGNAIDSGVAAGIAINVTMPQWTSFAGVAPIIIYLADKDEVVTISGVGRWPKAATLEYFRDTYGEIPIGVPRSAVPAACDAWLSALELYGTMTFEQVIQPSLELAEGGSPVSETFAARIKDFEKFLTAHPGSRELFFPNGKPLEEGQNLVQKDLAGVFRKMVAAERASAGQGREAGIRAARDFFYKGEVAEKMVRFAQEHDGLLTMEDFADFSVKVERPESGTYKDYTLFTCGPWSQGPSHIEVLNLLEPFDIRSMGHNSAEYIHAVTEAIKLSFSDRDAYYGDPEFVDVPMEGILSKEYAAERRKALDPARAWPELPPPGNPWPFQGVDRPAARGVIATPRRQAVPDLDTASSCAVDRWGNAFAATFSDSFGTTPIVPGLGMIISNRGGQSWLDPDVPNSLGPWKRPRLTPNPAIAFKDGKLFMPFATPGTDAQVQAMAQMFLNMVEFGMSAQQAVEEPRFVSYSFPGSYWPHPYYPGLVQLEGWIDRKVGERLARMGHEVGWWEDWSWEAGGLCGIMVDPTWDTLVGGADFRMECSAIGG